MTTQIEEKQKETIAEIAEKAISLAMLRTKSVVLSYEDVRFALEDLYEDADSVEEAVYEYTAEHYKYYDADDTSFDIIIPVKEVKLDPDLVEALTDEPNVLEHVVKKLLDVKLTECTRLWTPALEAYKRATRFFEIEEDWSEYSNYTYTFQFFPSCVLATSAMPTPP